MAQESREWYQNDTGFDEDKAANDHPTGQFSGEDIEFESFMFDSGQGVAADLFRSGPLSEASLAPSSATITMQAEPFAVTPSVPVPESPSVLPQSESQFGQVSPFMGGDAPMRFESEPLHTLQGVRPSQPLIGMQGSTPSTPLSPMQVDGTEVGHFSGSIALPESGPLRHTGPLVDGRTSASGPTTSGSLSSGQLSSDSHPSRPLSSDNRPQTGPLRADINTGPLSQSILERTQSGSSHQNGNGAGNSNNGNGNGSSIWPGANSSQSRLSGLLSQQQLEQTGSTDMTGRNTGPMSLPNRFMQTGPLTVVGAPDAPIMDTSAPLYEQSTPAVPTPTSPSMAMFSQGGWSDSSLAAVEDFSSLLLAMDGARRYMTSGSLSSNMLSDVATAQDLSYEHNTGAGYSDTLPVIHNTSPQVVEDSTHEIAAMMPQYDDGAYPLEVSQEPALWSAESSGETWDAQSVMPAVDAPSVGETPLVNVADNSFIAAPEWEALSDNRVAAEPGAPVQLDEGTFAGQSIEFESFMFDGGSSSTPELPRIEEFMPAVTGMEAAFTPAPTEQPQAPQMQSGPLTSSNGASPTHSPDGGLPFWLQGGGELSTLPVTDPAPAADGNLPAVSIDMDAQDYMVSETPGLSAPPSASNDYSDLPPIDPFDFTSLGLEVEEEGFGLNTEELSGYNNPHYDLMTATADLQVVASILGTDPDLETMPSEPLRPQMALSAVDPIQAEEPIASLTTATGELGDEQSNDFPTSQLGAPPKEADGQARSWTATVTSTLSLDALNSAQPGTISFSDDGVANDIEVAGLDVSPFSYTDLELDDEEPPTGVLNVPKFSKTGPLKSIAAADMPYSAPKPQSDSPTTSSANQSQTTNRIWSTSWLGDTSSQALEEKLLAVDPTLPFSTEALEQPEPANISPWQIQPDDAYTSALDTLSADDAQSDYEPVLSYTRDETLKTGSLAFDGEADDTLEEATAMDYPGEMTQQADPALSMTEWPNNDQPYNNGEDTGQAEHTLMGGAYAGMRSDTDHQQTWGAVAEPQSQQASPYETPVSSPYSYQPLQEEQEEPQLPARSENSSFGKREPARFPTSILTSGPLPSLDGFEELQEMITQNPDDVGAYMALAAAYAQVGDTDTQLRVFRRVLRKPSVSNKILRLIAEELSDYEVTFDGHPHFHQVRGDLYMKQNRYQEAIAEYNKIV